MSKIVLDIARLRKPHWKDVYNFADEEFRKEFGVPEGMEEEEEDVSEDSTTNGWKRYHTKSVEKRWRNWLSVLTDLSQVLFR